eukprot:m.167819 g.167819  ORF g.167819 m.167819 type:complete len:246 (+) comp38939_c0_seq8:1053-1790(+)
MKAGSLQCFFCNPQDIQRSCYEKMYSLGGCPEPTLDGFIAFLKRFNKAAIFRSKETGCLRGYLVWSLHENLTHDNRKCTCVKLGKMVVWHGFRRNFLAKFVMYGYLFKLWLSNFSTPVLAIFGRNPELYARVSSLSKKAFPRYDANTPDWEKTLLAKASKDLCADGCYYPESHLLCLKNINPVYHQASEQGFPSEEDIKKSKNPHIHHFFKLRPLEKKGCAFLSLVHIDFAFILSLLFKPNAPYP